MIYFAVILIRKATRDDAEKTVKLSNAVMRVAYAHIMPSSFFDDREKHKSEKIKQAKEFINSREQITFVAEHNGEIVGFAVAVIQSGQEHFKNLGYADLQAIYILPEFQNKGIGKMLFDNVVAEFGKMKLQKMVIGVLKENTAARKAYENWGGKINAYTALYKNQFPEVFYTFDI